MEDLQQMEARAIVAEERALKSEYCLLKLRQYLDDHADVEDRPDTNEVRPNNYMCVLIAMDTMLIDTTAARELMRKAEEADTLRTRLRESEALVERLRQCANRIHEIQCSKEVQAVYSLAMLHGQPYSGPTWEKVMYELRTLTPADALEPYRDEVLEEVAKSLEYPRLCLPLPAPADTLFTYADVVAGSIVEQIRAMKAPEKGGTR